MRIRINKLLTLFSILTVCGVVLAPGIVSNTNADIVEAGPMMIISGLVTVVIAVALLPTIANQTANLETDAAGDLDTTEETLIGLWPLLLIIGIAMTFVGFIT